jgi:primary-amine oxidase
VLLHSSIVIMVDRLKQVAFQVTATSPPPHPLDPLSATEIDTAVAVVREKYGNLNFNAVSLYEPRKAEMQAWLADPNKTPRPARCADVVAIGPKGKVYDGIVDLDQKKILEWKNTEGVQPIITMEELQQVEHIVRKDPKVIEQCEISGIPREEMDKVYCDRKLAGICFVSCADDIPR